MRTTVYKTFGETVDPQLSRIQVSVEDFPGQSWRSCRRLSPRSDHPVRSLVDRERPWSSGRLAFLGLGPFPAPICDRAGGLVGEIISSQKTAKKTRGPRMMCRTAYRVRDQCGGGEYLTVVIRELMAMRASLERHPSTPRQPRKRSPEIDFAQPPQLIVNARDRA